MESLASAARCSACCCSSRPFVRGAASAYLRFDAARTSSRAARCRSTRRTLPTRSIPIDERTRRMPDPPRSFTSTTTSRKRTTTCPTGGWPSSSAPSCSRSAYWFVYEMTRTRRPGPLAELRGGGGRGGQDAAPRPARSPNESLARAGRRRAGRRRRASRSSLDLRRPATGCRPRALVGPNLTDKFWLHGGTPGRHPQVDHRRLSRKGDAPVGADARRGPGAPVAAFVLSIKGKNLPGKPPQGEPVTK